MSGGFAALFCSCLVLYALAVALQIWGKVFRKEQWVSRASYIVIVGAAIHTVLVIWRWVETGHIPTIGDFENALVGGWFIVVMTLWAAWKQRYPLLAAGTLPFALLILGYGVMSDTSPRPMLATLQSGWLYVHIFFAWLAYGAYTVGCGASVVYLVKSGKRDPASAQVLAGLEELMVRSTIFGFITDSIMIAAGSIWAKNLWGSFWSWDPVETWSLLSWLVYGMALHLRFTMRWTGRRLAWLLVFAILGVLISFWGVNFVMGESTHVFNVG